MLYPNRVSTLQMILFHEISGYVGMPLGNIGDLPIIRVKELNSAAADTLDNDRVFGLNLFPLRSEILFGCIDYIFQPVVLHRRLVFQNRVQRSDGIVAHGDHHVISDSCQVKIIVRPTHDGHHVIDSAGHKHRCQNDEQEQYDVHGLFSFQIFS